jgi:uncharacterized alpha-E superfamily protein
VRPYEDILWAALLRSVSALEMYRKKHRRIVPDRLVDFLILDGEFPRSIHHCAVESDDAVRAILGTGDRRFTNRAEQVIGRFRARLDFTSVDEIRSAGVHQFIDSLQSELNSAHEAVFDTFFKVPDAV